MWPKSVTLQNTKGPRLDFRCCAVKSNRTFINMINLTLKLFYLSKKEHLKLLKVTEYIKQTATCLVTFNCTHWIFNLQNKILLSCLCLHEITVIHGVLQLSKGVLRNHKQNMRSCFVELCMFLKSTRIFTLTERSHWMIMTSLITASLLSHLSVNLKQPPALLRLCCVSLRGKFERNKHK